MGLLQGGWFWGSPLGPGCTRIPAGDQTPPVEQKHFRTLNARDQSLCRDDSVRLAGVGGVRGPDRVGDFDGGGGGFRGETSLCQLLQDLQLLHWLPLLVYRDELLRLRWVEVLPWFWIRCLVYYHIWFRQ